MLFDRICVNNGITHLLTAPYSPTTTGKVERFHKTLRKDFFAQADYKYDTIEELQAALDAWVLEYNTTRPHQSIGDRPPAERFALAGTFRTVDVELEELVEEDEPGGSLPAGVSRWVNSRGSIMVNRARYRVGPTFAGELVEVVVQRGLVQVLHGGVVVATHAERRSEGAGRRTSKTPQRARARRASSGMSVLRSVDNCGSTSFAGAPYRVGRAWRGQIVEVAIVAGSVQISANGRIIRVHPIRHDRSKEHGAFATPKGRPRNRRPA